MSRYPSAFGHMLGTADMLVNGAVELAIVGEVGSDEFAALERAAGERYVPSLVVAGGSGARGRAARGTRGARRAGDGVRVPELRVRGADGQSRATCRALEAATATEKK